MVGAKRALWRVEQATLLPLSPASQPFSIATCLCGSMTAPPQPWESLVCPCRLWPLSLRRRFSTLGTTQWRKPGRHGATWFRYHGLPHKISAERKFTRVLAQVKSYTQKSGTVVSTAMYDVRPCAFCNPFQTIRGQHNDLASAVSLRIRQILCV